MNRRSQKTRNEITRVFLGLLAEKPLKSITVKEVAERADVTRATFYSHYDDIYDLLEKSRAEAVAHIVGLLDKSIPEGSFMDFMIDFFSYFENREETFSLILGENGDMSFLVNTLHELRTHKDELIVGHEDEFFNGPIDKQMNEYQFIYLSGGLLHILTEWLSHENRISVEEIATIAAKFVEATCLVDIRK